jgi:plasmid maintenance system killer protein
MRIEFEDERLAIIRTPKAHRLGLPVAVIRSCRDKLLVIEAATTEQTLKNMRSLDYKKWKSSDEMQIRLNDQYRMRFRLDETTAPPTAWITFIGDPH